MDADWISPLETQKDSRSTLFCAVARHNWQSNADSDCTIILESSCRCSGCMVSGASGRWDGCLYSGLKV
jgi:hypothetical protein